MGPEPAWRRDRGALPKRLELLVLYRGALGAAFLTAKR
jgi:hypothetical protein